MKSKLVTICRQAKTYVLPAKTHLQRAFVPYNDTQLLYVTLDENFNRINKYDDIVMESTTIYREKTIRINGVDIKFTLYCILMKDRVVIITTPIRYHDKTVLEVRRISFEDWDKPSST